LNLKNLAPWVGKPDAEERRLRAARAGDRAAFDMVMRSHEQELRGFLSRKVSTEDVDDLLQDTWLAAWVALPSYDGRGRFKSWLYKLAIHKFQDHLRDKYRSVQQVQVDTIADSWPSPSDAYAAADLRDSTRALLESLSPAQRDVVELYYFAELTLPEIARALDRNLNTVKYQFYRAHAQAAEKLAEQNALEGPEVRSLGVEAWL
jgi:RNA polymerase sigma-70 factor, ECF subfamily